MGERGQRRSGGQCEEPGVTVRKGWGGGHYHPTSACLLCQLLECVGVLHALSTKTSSRDGPELGGDRFKQLRGWTRDLSPNPS